MPSIISIGTGRASGYKQRRVFNALSSAQRELRAVYWPIFDGCGINSRPLYSTPEDMVKHSPQEQQEKYEEAILELSSRAITLALERAEVKPDEIGQVVFASCTGVPACPSFPSTLAGRLGMKHEAIFYPLHGIGCQGSGPALRAAWEHLRLYPMDKSLVVSCEISSGSYHPKIMDGSGINKGLVIGEAIFGDGAGCALLSGHWGKGLYLLDFFHYTEFSEAHSIGMDWVENRYRLVLAPNAVDIIVPVAKKAITTLLRKADILPEEVKHFIIHSGGASIIKNLAESMNIPDEKVRISWETWREVGNLSSATIMFALEKLLGENLKRDDYVVIVTLGAGLEADVILANGF